MRVKSVCRQICQTTRKRMATFPPQRWHLTSSMTVKPTKSRRLLFHLRDANGNEGESFKTVIHVFVGSQMDFCIALNFGVSQPPLKHHRPSVYSKNPVLVTYLKPPPHWAANNFRKFSKVPDVAFKVGNLCQNRRQMFANNSILSVQDSLAAIAGQCPAIVWQTRATLNEPWREGNIRYLGKHSRDCSQLTAVGAEMFTLPSCSIIHLINCLHLFFCFPNSVCLVVFSKQNGVEITSRFS